MFADRTCSKILLRRNISTQTMSVCLYDYCLSFIDKVKEHRVETVKLVKSKTWGKNCHHWSVLSIPACVQRTVQDFFPSVDLYSLYISSCSLPMFLFLQPGFSSVVLTSLSIGGLAHMHIPAINRWHYVACTKSKDSVWHAHTHNLARSSHNLGRSFLNCRIRW